MCIKGAIWLMFELDKLLLFLNINRIKPAVRNTIRRSSFMAADLETLIQGFSIPDKTLNQDMRRRLSGLVKDNLRVQPLRQFRLLCENASLLNKNGYIKHAIPLYFTAIDILTTLPGNETDLAGVLLDSAMSLMLVEAYGLSYKMLKYAYLIFWHKKLLLQEAKVLDYMGIYFARQNMQKHALHCFHRSLDIYKKNQKYSKMVDVIKDMSSLYIAKGELERAQELLGRAESYASKDNNIQLAIEILNYETDLYLDRDKLKHAIESQSICSDLCAKLSDSHETQLIDSDRKRALIYILLGEYAQANDLLLPSLDRSLYEQEELYGAEVLMAIARLNNQMGDFKTAEECLASVAKIMSNNLFSASTRCRYYAALHVTRNMLYNEARNQEKKLAAFVTDHSLSFLEQAECLFILTDIALVKKDIVYARTCLERIQPQIETYNNPSVRAQYLLKQSRVLFFGGSGKSREAMDMRKDAWHLTSKILNPKLKLVIKHAMARYLHKSGNKADAKSEYEQSIEILSKMSRKLPKNFEKNLFFRHPEHYKLLKDYWSLLTTEKERNTALELFKALEITEIGLQ